MIFNISPTYFESNQKSRLRAKTENSIDSIYISKKSGVKMPNSSPPQQLILNLPFITPKAPKMKSETTGLNNSSYSFFPKNTKKSTINNFDLLMISSSRLSRKRPRSRIVSFEKRKSTSSKNLKKNLIKSGRKIDFFREKEQILSYKNVSSTIKDIKKKLKKLKNF